MRNYNLYAKDRGRSWEARHNSALRSPSGPERDILSLIQPWLDYAAGYGARWGREIGEDSYAGPCWARIGAELRQLLSMELGRLDGGTLDKAICSLLEANGFDPVDY